jgi:hypothetical protein
MQLLGTTQSHGPERIPQTTSNTSHCDTSQSEFRSSIGFLDSIAEVPPSQQLQQYERGVPELDSYRSSQDQVAEPSLDSGYGGSLKNCNCEGICSCRAAGVAMHGDDLIAATVPGSSHNEQENDFSRWPASPDLEFMDSVDQNYDWSCMEI